MTGEELAMRMREATQASGAVVHEQEVNTPYRAQGNTFRHLLRALIIASEEPNRNVYYVCAHHEIARWSFGKAASMVCGVWQMGKAYEQSRKLTLPNGSWVQFIVSQRVTDELHSKRGDIHILFDHYQPAWV